MDIEADIVPARGQRQKEDTDFLNNSPIYNRIHKERSYFDPSGRETSSKHSQTRSFTVGSQFHSHHEGTRRLQEFCRGKNKE